MVSKKELISLCGNAPLKEKSRWRVFEDNNRYEQGGGYLISEKVPIHFRSNKKQIVPAAACAHDLTAPPDIVQDVEESGRSSRSSSHLSPNTQKAPAYLPGWLYGYYALSLLVVY